MYGGIECQGRKFASQMNPDARFIYAGKGIPWRHKQVFTDADRFMEKDKNDQGYWIFLDRKKNVEKVFCSSKQYNTKEIIFVFPQKYKYIRQCIVNYIKVLRYSDDFLSRYDQ